MGSASYVTKDGMRVGALVAVNSLGSAIVPGTKQFWSGPFEIGNEFGGLGASNKRVIGEDWGQTKVNPGARTNTTIACIATDVELDADQMKRVTMMAQDGLARAIRPIHSPFDGDVVFGFSTAKQKIKGPSADFVVARIGAGIQVSTNAGVDIRLQYDGEFSDRVSSNAGSLKAIIPF